MTTTSRNTTHDHACALPARGCFLSVEGVDGSGKSTHLRAIADHIQHQVLAPRGLSLRITREPGGTRLGEALRELLLHYPMQADTEALLMFAARAEHVHQVILPALARGEWVLSDRFTDASFAYQGGGRGLSTARLASLENWVQGPAASSQSMQTAEGPHTLLQPDLTLLFDLPPDVARTRRTTQRGEGDRFERQADCFFTRVRAAYHARAAADPLRVRVIDAQGSVASVQHAVFTVLDAWLKDHVGRR